MMTPQTHPQSHFRDSKQPLEGTTAAARTTRARTGGDGGAS